jgi:hypothetical protein
MTLTCPVRQLSQKKGAAVGAIIASFAWKNRVSRGTPSVINTGLSAWENKLMYTKKGLFNLTLPDIRPELGVPLLERGPCLRLEPFIFRDLLNLCELGLFQLTNRVLPLSCVFL